MSSKKVFFGVVIILFITSVLSAQVNFQYEFGLNKLNDSDRLENIQLYDYDNDGIQEITVQYWDGPRDNWKIVIYNNLGDTLRVQQIDNCEMSKFQLFNNNGQNCLFMTGPYSNRFEFIVKDFETLNTIDSIYDDDNYYSWINTVEQYLCSGENQFLVGYTKRFLDDSDDYMCRLSFENDTLIFKEIYSDCGQSNISINDSTFLATGQSAVSYPAGGYVEYTLQKIVLEHSIEQIDSVSGSSHWDTTYIYDGYPVYYKIITKNCDDTFAQVIQYLELDTDEGTSVHFEAYDTVDWQNIWSMTDTEIGTGDITASTCLEVNGEDHYVMYFRGDKLEIRDRLTGNIIHHQDSVLAVTDILRKSDGELLFFVEKDDETGYDVYTLDGPIFVSNDDPHEPTDLLIEHYPNPFRNSISFKLSLTTENTEETEIKIFNIKGQLVRELHPVASSPTHSIEITWDGKDSNYRNVPEGVYLYKVTMPDHECAGKMVKIK